MLEGAGRGSEARGAGPSTAGSHAAASTAVCGARPREQTWDQSHPAVRVYCNLHVM